MRYFGIEKSHVGRQSRGPEIQVSTTKLFGDRLLKGESCFQKNHMVANSEGEWLGRGELYTGQPAGGGGELGQLWVDGGGVG